MKMLIKDIDAEGLLDQQARAYQYQVAGHEKLQEITLARKQLPEGIIGNLTSDSIFAVMKPTNEQEYIFYSEIIKRFPRVSSRWLPEFYGALLIPSRKTIKETHWIFLCDLIRKHSIKTPVVLDVKIGQRQYGDDVEPRKKLKMIKLVEETSSKNYGFRITGLLMDGQDRLTLDKKTCKEYKDETQLVEIMNFFFGSDQRLATLFRQKLLEMHTDFSDTSNYLRLYSCSLLMIYDRSNPYDTVHLKIIDFAHSYVHEEKIDTDDKVLFGLKSLHDLLSKIET